jgi:uncharacterized protein YqgC (DUF456 family)
MLDYLLLVLGIILMLAGIIGCILPVIPGPSLSFLGLILLHLSRFAHFSAKFLVLMGLITLIVTVLDYVVPVWGTKKLGGSKAGIWGAGIGMGVGIFFFPPLGIILGPFIGAVIAELYKGAQFHQSIRSGMGSLVGFMAGTGLKLIASFVMTYYFIVALF